MTYINMPMAPGYQLMKSQPTEATQVSPMSYFYKLKLKYPRNSISLTVKHTRALPLCEYFGCNLQTVRGNLDVAGGSKDEVSESVPQMGTVNTLTQRQYEVFRLLGQGYTIREIGKQMNIGKKTVHTYVFRIKEKLGLFNTAELVRSAFIHNK